MILCKHKKWVTVEWVDRATKGIGIGLVRWSMFKTLEASNFRFKNFILRLTGVGQLPPCFP